jgi:hypothetical protein
MPRNGVLLACAGVNVKRAVEIRDPGVLGQPMDFLSHDLRRAEEPVFIARIMHQSFELKLHDGPAGNLAMRQGITGIVDLIQPVAPGNEAIEGQTALSEPAYEHG